MSAEQGVGGLPGLGDQPVSQMNHPANLRRNNPDSVGVEFIPLNKRGRSSVLMKDNMDLQTLIQNTSKQVAQLCQIISKMQSAEERESLRNQAIPKTEEQSLANTPEMMGNHSMDPNNASPSVHIHPNLELFPSGAFVKANGVGNSNGTMISPTVLKNDNSHDSSLSPDSVSLHIGYLGNPERNVRILKMHLMNAQRKPEPKQAARYLARVLFTKEILICSSVGPNPYQPNLRNHQPLDPNKLAAIREFLTTIFPNCDLRENGKEWRSCLTYMNALIHYLGSTIRRTPEIVVTTNPNIPASANLNNNRDGDGGEGSSQLSQQAAVSEARARANYQANSSAVPEGVEKPSTSGLPIPFGALEYIGNPSRNIKLSHSVLMVAKRKACPEMSASYLMNHLFPEEVLQKSDACGNLWHGICAFNFNRISALREFLQEAFPKCDLSENGRDWKLCMQSINCHSGSCRGGHGTLTCASLPFTVITTTIKSESSDTDYSD